MNHPASHDLLRTVFWPMSKNRRHRGVLKWERFFDGTPVVGAQEIKVALTAAVCSKHLVLRSHHTLANGETQPGLEIRWDWQPGRAPALVRFIDKGQEQPLVEAAALNRFKGQVYRANVAPYWAE
jgi:hypothetical protein